MPMGVFSEHDVAHGLDAKTVELSANLMVCIDLHRRL